MEHTIIFTAAACIIGFFMATGVGANGLGNIMSPALGSKSITVKQALIIATIFEFAGAFLGGEGVTNTIRSGIINIQLFSHTPEILVLGMLSVLLASMIWMIFTSLVGMPVSITNAIVGSLIGFGALVLGVHTVHWDMITKIAISWVLSPAIAGLVAFLLFTLIKSLILSKADPGKSARRYLPFFFFIVGVVLAVMIVLKDLSHFGLHLALFRRVILTVVVAIIIVIVGHLLCKRIDVSKFKSHHQRFEYVEKLFKILMIFTACAMVFALGSNDIAIAVGPIAAIVSIAKHHGQIVMHDDFPYWAMLMGCSAVVVGLFTYGRKVIETVGEGITRLTPSRAFAAMISAATTVIFLTSSGIPISASQTLVGGVLGVGFARGIGALNLRVMRNIFLSWVVTVPAAAILSIGCYYLLRLVFRV